MKVQVLLLLACLLLSSLAFPVLADISWTSAPMLAPEKVEDANRRTQYRFRALNMDTQRVVAFPPSEGNSKPRNLQAAGDGSFTLQIAGRGEGNYHWITASDTGGRRIASTVHYFSNPGPAPRRMLQQNKVSLEIRPVDLPREHWRFRANETWLFQVLAQGKPLAEANVQMETSNGSTQALTSDSKGLVTLTFPDDFKAQTEQPQHHAGGHAGHRPPHASFVLSAQHDGITSAFNYKYSPDAFTNKAVLPATGLLFTGMLTTGMLLFYRRKA